MAIVHPVAIRNELADLVVDHADDGAGAGKVQITKVVDSYIAGDIVAEITLADPAFGAAASGVATASGLPKSDSSANNTGTAVQFRQVDSDDTEVFKGTVTVTGGGGDMEMISTSVTIGEPVDVTAYTYTAPL